MTLRMARGIIYVKFILMHVRPSYFFSTRQEMPKIFLFRICTVALDYICSDHLNCRFKLHGKMIANHWQTKTHKHTHVLKNEWFYFLTFPEKKRFIWLLLLQGVSKVKLLQLPWASLISEYRYVGIYCKMHTYTHNEGKSNFF